MAVEKGSRRRRVISVGAVLAVFGGMAGTVMHKRDAWSAWLGRPLDETESVLAGATIGAVLGAIAGAFGGRGRPRDGGSSRDGGGDGGGD